MGERFHDPTPTGGITEHLNPGGINGPLPAQDFGSILQESDQYFQLDLDQAPKAIATFRKAAEELRALKREVSRLAHVGAPGSDGVSINAAKEIGQWAVTEEPGSLRAALESGAMQLESTADALERSAATHQNTDEASAAHLRRSEL